MRFEECRANSRKSSRTLRRTGNGRRLQPRVPLAPLPLRFPPFLHQNAFDFIAGSRSVKTGTSSLVLTNAHRAPSGSTYPAASRPSYASVVRKNTHFEIIDKPYEGPGVAIDETIDSVDGSAETFDSRQKSSLEVKEVSPNVVVKPRKFKASEALEVGDNVVKIEASETGTADPSVGTSVTPSKPTYANVVDSAAKTSSKKETRNPEVVKLCVSEKTGEAKSSNASHAIMKNDNKLEPRILIRDVPVDISKEKLLRELVANNLDAKDKRRVKHVYLFPHRGKEHTNHVLQVSPEIRKKLIAKGKIYIARNVCRVEDHVRVTQCFRCLGFGHLAPICEKNVHCGHCAGEHETRTCTVAEAFFICYNCKNADLMYYHSALDVKKCTVLKKKFDERITLIHY